MADLRLMAQPSIDLSSEIAARPSAGMLRAIANAEIGDDQRREDPTVIKLEERAAELLGKAAGVFLPSGTMCNVLALYVLCRAGDEVLAEASSHIVCNEDGGAAVHARVTLRTVVGERGVFGPTAVDTFASSGRYGGSRPACVCIENTHTRSGGSVWPAHLHRAVQQRAKSAGLHSHMDGARLFNAAIAGRVSPASLAAGFDSVWISLAKGLGSPVGAVLVGDASYIEDVRRARKLFGGGMGKPGMMAAAGLYALDNNIEHLKEDHRNARLFAEAAAEIDGIAIDVEQVETNIVLLDIAETRIDPVDLLLELRRKSVRFGLVEATVLRAVTHLDIKPADVSAALDALREAVATLSPLRNPAKGVGRRRRAWTEMDGAAAS
jgi:threonine aldolase